MAVPKVQCYCGWVERGRVPSWRDRGLGRQLGEYRTVAMVQLREAKGGGG